MLTGTTTEQKIWNFLKGKGLSAAGVAGLMGNLYAESALNPQNLQNTYERPLGYTDASYTAAVDNGSYTNFVRDFAGYGLAQWTFGTRKQALLSFVRGRNASIGDLEAQLHFLWKELSESYRGVLTVLQTTDSIRAASDEVLTKFERPANMSENVKVRRASYGQTYYDKYAGDTAPGHSVSTGIGGKMTAKELVAKAVDIAKNRNTVYMWGVFGAPVTESTIADKSKQYPNWYTAEKQASFRRLIGKGYFGFDCVNLIKGILWGWTGDNSKRYGGAKYASNGVPDIGADTMITKCSGVSTTGWDRMEIGEALWCAGHIGLYIGDGLAVECTPAWANKVQITAVKNIGAKAGYNARTWTKHGKLPYVTYDGKVEAPITDLGQTTNTNAAAYKVGDIVEFTGSKHYVSADASRNMRCKSGKAKVTATHLRGKHPIHLVAINGGGSTVYGWVDVADIKASSTGEVAQNWTPKVGDTVFYNGTTHFTAANAVNPKICKGGKARITAIYQPGKAKHPYHLVRVAGGGSTVYGWVNAGTFTKV